MSTPYISILVLRNVKKILCALLFRNDNTRTGMVNALKQLLTPAQLEAGDQYIKQRISGKGSLGPDTLVEEAAEPEASVVK